MLAVQHRLQSLSSFDNKFSLIKKFSLLSKVYIYCFLADFVFMKENFSYYFSVRVNKFLHGLSEVGLQRSNKCVKYLMIINGKIFTKGLID